jgi:hypothetical protein
MKIFIQSPHNDPLQVEVDAASTVKDLKQLCQLVGANIRYKGAPLLNTDTLESKEIKAGDTLHLFPPNKERSGGATYQAQQRLIKGSTLKSTAHPSLHQQTQAVVMDASRRTQEIVNNRCDKLEEQVEKLLDYHEKAPPSNPSDLDLMAKVLNRFKVARMNEILKKYHVDRPAGVKKEGKAALIVKHVPSTQLLQLLEESGSLSKTDSGMSKTEDAWTPPCPKTVSRLESKIPQFRQMTLEENQNMYRKSTIMVSEREEEPDVSTKRRRLGSQPPMTL